MYLYGLSPVPPVLVIPSDFLGFPRNHDLLLGLTYGLGPWSGPGVGAITGQGGRDGEEVPNETMRTTVFSRTTWLEGAAVEFLYLYFFCPM